MTLAKNIEWGKECDLQALLSLQKTAFMEVAKQMNTLPLLQDIHNNFDTYVILKYISSENQIVGSIKGNIFDNHICHIGKQIVHPDFQNRGIGKVLMYKIEKYFTACLKFTLFTGKRNAQHITPLYQSRLSRCL